MSLGTAKRDTPSSSRPSSSSAAAYAAAAADPAAAAAAGAGVPSELEQHRKRLAAAGNPKGGDAASAHTAESGGVMRDRLNSIARLSFTLRRQYASVSRASAAAAAATPTAAVAAAAAAAAGSSSRSSRVSYARPLKADRLNSVVFAAKGATGSLLLHARRSNGLTSFSNGPVDHSGFPGSSRSSGRTDSRASSRSSGLGGATPQRVRLLQQQSLSCRQTNDANPAEDELGENAEEGNGQGGGETNEKPAGEQSLFTYACEKKEEVSSVQRGRTVSHTSSPRFPFSDEGDQTNEEAGGEAPPAGALGSPAGDSENAGADLLSICEAIDSWDSEKILACIRSLRPHGRAVYDEAKQRLSRDLRREIYKQFEPLKNELDSRGVFDEKTNALRVRAKLRCRGHMANQQLRSAFNKFALKGEFAFFIQALLSSPTASYFGRDVEKAMTEELYALLRNPVMGEGRSDFRIELFPSVRWLPPVYTPLADAEDDAAIQRICRLKQLKDREILRGIHGL
ncbi:hypothetical protein Efla_000181 [Eimeria flavescens]